MEELIRVENLVQRAGGKVILDNVSFTVGAGEAFGLFGVQGSGKTSLLHILAGVDRFSSGTVEVCGFNVRKSEKFKKEMGLVTQVPSLFRDLSAAENLDFLAALKGASGNSVKETVKRLELAGCLKERAAKMLPGPYRRLSLACALLGNPRILLVDDFADNLDKKSLKLILGEISRFHQEGGTLVTVFNRPDFFNRAARVGFLEEGRMQVLEAKAATELWRSQMDYVSGGRGENG